ncbi:MAG: hypothetical protein GY721_13560 [Deltaproteobacteria bacterium]|nr:hypothetical protein [Deltaproteobacteria bacterium]
MDKRKTFVKEITAPSLRVLKKHQADYHQRGTTATLCGGPTVGWWLNVRTLVKEDDIEVNE